MERDDLNRLTDGVHVYFLGWDGRVRWALAESPGDDLGIPTHGAEGTLEDAVGAAWAMHRQRNPK